VSPLSQLILRERTVRRTVAAATERGSQGDGGSTLALGEHSPVRASRTNGGDGGGGGITAEEMVQRVSSSIGTPGHGILWPTLVGRDSTDGASRTVSATGVEPMTTEGLRTSGGLVQRKTSKLGTPSAGGQAVADSHPGSAPASRQPSGALGIRPESGPRTAAAPDAGGSGDYGRSKTAGHLPTIESQREYLGASGKMGAGAKANKAAWSDARPVAEEMVGDGSLTCSHSALRYLARIVCLCSPSPPPGTSSHKL
jgi:hypothetical protein